MGLLHHSLQLLLDHSRVHIIIIIRTMLRFVVVCCLAVSLLTARSSGQRDPWAADTNGDRKFSLDEFKAQMAKEMGGELPDVYIPIIEGQFNGYDINGDGFLTMDEMMSVAGVRK